MNRYEDGEYNDAERRLTPCGHPLNEFLDELHEGAEGSNQVDLQHLARQEPMKTFIQEYLEDDWNLFDRNMEQAIRLLPHKAFAGFTTDELVRYYYNSVISTDLEDMMRANPRYRIFTKLRESFWHYGYENKDYNLLVRFYNALRSFNFGEGFEVFLDYVTSYNRRGYSQYNRVYLDGTFGYMIYHKGIHVMTIGFCASRFGLLITQIQLVKPKGNRWLFKLPNHYFTHTLNCLAEAFKDFRMLLIDGESHANQTKRSYGNEDHKLTDEMFKHIVKTYKQPLKNYKRSGYRRIQNLRFHYLHPKETARLTPMVMM